MSYNNLYEDSKKIIQPKNINIELMEHQKTIIHAMIDLEAHGKITTTNVTQYNDSKDFNILTNIGILSDKVGAGKSLAIISLITLHKTPIQRDIYWSGSRYLCITETVKEVVQDVNILIVPHKLVPQWLKFFDSATTHLKVRTYINSTDEDSIKTVDDLKNCDVLIIACTKSESFFLTFNTTRWARVIIDEADTIKLPKNFEINALFIWLVTATPKKLRYSNRTYIANTFKEILPWAFEYLIVKNSDDFVDKSIVLPPPKRITIPCKTPAELGIVKNIIPKNAIAMINAGNTEEAIKMLNFNTDTTDNIMKVITNNLRNVIEDKKKELDYEINKIKTFMKPGSKAEEEHENKKKFLKKCIMRLEERYNSIREKIYSLNDQYCPICMDEFTKPTLVNCCQNVFCLECITLCLKHNKCPSCSKNLYQKDFHVISKEKVVAKTNYDKKDKLETLLSIIETKPKGKFMIFANFPQTFEKIERTLKEKGVSYNILKGSASNINKIINEFSESKIKILMLNANYFGAGMNLQMASDIVFYHSFGREMEEQIIGRAQRLGREGQLSVFYLLHDNETSDLMTSNKFEEINYYDWLEAN